MNEILTPDEIAALTAAFAADGPGTTRAPVSAVRTVDLTNQERSLEIRVVVNGQEVATRSTIKPFGLVTLTYRSGGTPERPSDRSRR